MIFLTRPCQVLKRDRLRGISITYCVFISRIEKKNVCAQYIKNNGWKYVVGKVLVEKLTQEIFPTLN